MGGGASGGRGGFAVPFHSVSKTVAPSNVIPIWLNTQSCFFDDCVTQIGRINSLSFFLSLRLSFNLRCTQSVCVTLP